MKTIVGILAAVIASVTLPAADPPGFAIWKAADLKPHDAALSTHVADDHSSRETRGKWETVEYVQDLVASGKKKGFTSFSSSLSLTRPRFRRRTLTFAIARSYCFFTAA